jgi:hypothetical protein
MLTAVSAGDDAISIGVDHREHGTYPSYLSSPWHPEHAFVDTIYTVRDWWHTLAEGLY